MRSLLPAATSHSLLICCALLFCLRRGGDSLPLRFRFHNLHFMCSQQPQQSAGALVRAVLLPSTRSVAVGSGRAMGDAEGQLLTGACWADPGAGKVVLESWRRFSSLAVSQVAGNGVWLFSWR